MQLLLLTLLAIGGVFADIDHNRDVAMGELIIPFLDCLREIGYTGNEELAIPIMDPLFVEGAFSDLSVDTGITGLSGTALAVNVAISGILGFEYYSVYGVMDIIPPRFNFDITLRFPRVQASIDQYDVNIVHEETSTYLYGCGRIAFVATDIFVRFKLTLHLAGVPFQRVSIVPSTYRMESFVITGLFNDEEYSAQLSNDFITNHSGSMANISGTIDAAWSPILTEVLNDALLAKQCTFP